MDIEQKIKEIILKYDKETGQKYSELLTLESDYLSNRIEKDMIERIYEKVRGVKE